MNSEETVREAATRHWRCSTGLAPSRLETAQNIHVDDQMRACRYLIADCGEPEAGTQQPDSWRWAWTPPTLQRNQDPVTKVRWVSIDHVLEMTTLLFPLGVRLLAGALGHREAVQSRARGLDADRETKAQTKARGEPLRLLTRAQREAAENK